ncbi:hypothetical protein [Micromonospora sp. SH-82]|uniref:hypothetical protein n=1 Tax=Micromonospora sp. SH-82 TaxID=3132938 RepID=UPI003EBFE1B7
MNYSSAEVAKKVRGLSPDEQGAILAPEQPVLAALDARRELGPPGTRGISNFRAQVALGKAVEAAINNIDRDTVAQTDPNTFLTDYKVMDRFEQLSEQQQSAVQQDPAVQSAAVHLMQQKRVHGRHQDLMVGAADPSEDRRSAARNALVAMVPSSMSSDLGHYRNPGHLVGRDPLSPTDSAAHVHFLTGDGEEYLKKFRAGRYGRLGNEISHQFEVAVQKGTASKNSLYFRADEQVDSARASYNRAVDRAIETAGNQAGGVYAMAAQVASSSHSGGAQYGGAQYGSYTAPSSQPGRSPSPSFGR